MSERRRFYVSGLLVLAASLAPVVARAAGKITGTIASRDSIAVPAQAIVLVSLRDVSLADAAAEEISSVTVRPKRQPPLPFVLRYDPVRIHPAHTYAVSARVTVDGRLAFISTRQYPVITRGGGRRVEIGVDPVGEPRNQVTSRIR